MATFLIGLGLFIGAHLFTGVARGTRASIISRIGEPAYKIAIAIISLVGLVLVYRGWPEANASVLYTTPYALRYVTYLLVLVSFILVTAAYLPAGKIAEATKHPMVLAVKVWAVAHLLVNGEVRSVILFGALLAWAVVDRIAVKKRGDNGRTARSPVNDVMALVVGTVGFVAVYLWLHPYIAGVRLY